MKNTETSINKETIKLISRIFIIFLVCSCIFVSGISGAVKSGANFLKFGIGARPLGMGGAYVAVADDVNALWWNPAGIAVMKDREITLMHNEVGEDVYHQFLAYTQPVTKLRGNIGGSLSYLSVSRIQGYSAGGVSTGKLDAYDLGVNLTYAAMIVKGVYGGTSLKLIQEKLDTKKAAAFALDAGGLWKTSIDGLGFGFNIQNIGKGLKFINETSPLPLNFKVGTAYSFSVFGNETIMALDANFPSDYSTYYNIGGECRFYELFAIRAGYKTKDDLANGLRLGGGLKGKNLKVDYAWMPRGDLEDSHRIAVTIRFGRRYRESEIEKNIRDHFEKGKKYFRSGYMLRAYNEFKDILLVAPRHKGAQDYVSRIELDIESAEVAKDIDVTFKKGEEYFQKGDLTAARAAFESILGLDPVHQSAKGRIKDIDVRFEEVVNSILEDGRRQYEEADYSKAMIEINKVLALDPDNTEALKYHKLLEAKNRELEKIRVALEQEQKERVEQRKIAAWREKAENSYEKKQWENAIKAYTELLKIDPDDLTLRERIAAIYYQKGISLKEMSKLQEAHKSFDMALKYNPAHGAAKDEANTLTEEFQDNAKEYNRKGLVEYSKGNLDKAIAYWEKALEFDSSNISALENLKRAKKEK
ncbi:MAG: PorV/PorQ family protein [Elusimicrobiota bacterium]